MKLKIIFILSIILAFKNAQGQDLKFYGSKFSHFYTDENLKNVSQTWSIVQDSRGVMYFGANTLLVVYNGKDWQTYSLNNNSVRSMALDKNGRLYVGLTGDFGYLEPDSTGGFEYHSLIDLLPDSIEFNDVWKIIVDDKNNAVYFFTVHYDFIYKDNKIKILTDRMQSLFGEKIQGKVYLYAYPKGICEIDADTLKPIKGMDKIAPLHGFVNCLDFSPDTMLIIAANSGMFLYNIKTGDVKNFEADTNIFNYIHINQGLTVCKLDDENFAVGTFYGGVIVFNKKGQLVNIYNASKGLKNDCIYAMYTDKNHNLWLGTQKGIIKVETSSPLSYYGEQQNVTSYNTKNFVFGNNFYLGTLDSLYYLEKYKFTLTNNNQVFKSIKGTESVWGQIVFKNKLFVSGRAGVHLIENKKSTTVFTSNNTILSLGKSSKFKDYLLIGHKQGLIAAKYDSIRKKLIPVYNFDDINYEIRSIVEDADSNLWIGTFNNGVMRIIFTGNSIENYKTELYGEQYFPEIHDNTPFFIDNRIIILTDVGIYKPVKSQNSDEITSFVPDTSFGEDFYKDSINVTGIIKLNDTLYFYSGESTGFIVKKPSGAYRETYMFRGIRATQINHYKNYLFLSTPYEFYVYDLNVHKNYDIPFNTLITEVSVNSDSTIFYGNFYKYGKDSVKILCTNQPENFYTVLKYSENSISFKFSSTDFQDEEKTEFKYKLEGFDKEWHNYSKENKAVYTNIKEGKYTFKVVARNIFGRTGTVATYSFEVLPPWYRTWWAYAIFTVIGLFLLFVIIKLYTLRLKRQNIKLEQTVKERTKEISRKNEELMQQKEEILAQAEELEKVNKELAKLTLVAEKTDNVVIIFDENLNIEWVNEAFNKIYSGNYIGENLIERSSIDNIEDLLNEIKTKKTSVEVTYKLKGEGFNATWMKTTFSPVLNFDGEIEKIIAIETDISEIKFAQKQIEEKNELIQSSLNYALTIQQSILPDKEIMRQFFDIEILYRPKDIVSGDFYWFSEKYSNADKSEFQVFFSVADCTGHGVPGAFMSLISSRLLDEIVNMNNVVDPAQILLELSKRIEKVLHQDKNINKDGVDLALCRFTKSETDENIELIFAGSKRPLFYYNKTEFLRIKGDRTSIGGNNNKTKIFTNKSFTLSKDDIIYLMSDGYVDQNNEQRLKIGTVKFKELILNNITKSPYEQIKLLEDFLNQWQAGTYQRDDITVAGIKIK